MQKKRLERAGVRETLHIRSAKHIRRVENPPKLKISGAPCSASYQKKTAQYRLSTVRQKHKGELYSLYRVRIGETTQAQIELREATLAVGLAGRRRRFRIVDHDDGHIARRGIERLVLLGLHQTGLFTPNLGENAMLQHGRDWRQNAIGDGVGIGATGRPIEEILIVEAVLVFGQQGCALFAAATAVAVRHCLD